MLRQGLLPMIVLLLIAIAPALGQDRAAINTEAASESRAAARFAENWSKVEGVFFRSAANFGVGGMVVIEYEPLILFEDATIMRWVVRRSKTSTFRLK